MEKRSCIECEHIYVKKSTSWIYRVLVAFDQLGNALADGNPDATISARVGYHSITVKGRTRYYWKLMERIINFSFYPVDGKDHCLKSYCADVDEKFMLGSDVARVFLSFLIIPFSLVIALLLYPICFLFPSLKNNY